MTALGRVACATCEHPGAFHVLPIGACRRNGCPCERFADPSRQGQPDESTDERTVLLHIPEGYVLNVQFVPIAATDGS